MKKFVPIEKLLRSSRQIQALLRSSSVSVDQAAALWRAAVAEFCRELENESNAILARLDAGEHDAAV